MDKSNFLSVPSWGLKAKDGMYQFDQFLIGTLYLPRPVYFKPSYTLKSKFYG